MKIVIDMNLTPAWVEFFAARGIESTHWSRAGNPSALDSEIMAYARERDFVVFTHDLDFGDILAASHARGPSVIQVRIDDPLPNVIGDAVVQALQANADHLQRGALVTIDPHRSRVRILPIVPDLAT